MKQRLFIIFLISFSIKLYGQVVDKISAIVGDKVVLLSEIENQYIQMLSQGNTKSQELKCQVFEDLITQKLLIFSSKEDSILLSDDEIEQEVQSRLDYYVEQIGNIEKVEQYFEKDIYQIKKVLFNLVKDQLLIQKMQSNITNDIKITPFDVNLYYESLDKNDIPYLKDKYKLSQIIVKPKMSEEEINKIINRLNSFRKRINDGEDFKVLAALYSDDPGSSNKGGEIGYVSRGIFVKEFEKAAFRLKIGEVSEVVKTNFGYHIIQLIDRKDEKVNVRHILIKPKYSSTSLQKAKIRADSIHSLLKNNDISFSTAVQRYSDDKSKNNDGLLVNPSNGSSSYTIDELGSSISFLVKNLNNNEFTSPKKVESNEGTVYRILNVVEKIDSHIANLDLDYDLFQNLALNQKKQFKLDEWVENRIENTYINIKSFDKNCKYRYKW